MTDITVTGVIVIACLAVAGVILLGGFNDSNDGPLETNLYENFKHYNATIQTNASQAEIQSWLRDRKASVIMNADLVEDGMLFWASENATPVYWED